MRFNQIYTLNNFKNENRLANLNYSFNSAKMAWKKKQCLSKIIKKTGKRKSKICPRNVDNENYIFYTQNTKNIHIKFKCTIVSSVQFQYTRADTAII